VKPLIFSREITLQAGPLLDAQFLLVRRENLSKIPPKVSDRLRLRDYLSAYAY